MSRPVFLSYAGIDQLLIATVEDLERLDTLDKARWAATSVPCEQLFADPVLLDFLDTDHNHRIRVDELKAARRWLWERLRVRDGVIAGSDTVLLDHIDPGHRDGKQLHALAERLLHELHAPVLDRVTLEQVRCFKSAYVATLPNGDGVVTPAQLSDAPVAALASAILSVTGGAIDLSGERGAREQDIDTYLARVDAYAAWSARGARDARILTPLGDDTPAAVALIDGLSAKMEQFFAQCALVALEAGATHRLSATREELQALDVTSPAEIARFLATAPLARPNAEGTLPLVGATNPHFAAALSALARDIGPRALGRDGPMDSLSVADWAALRAVFAPGVAHLNARPVGIPADADPDLLVASVRQPTVALLRALVAEDLRAAAELREISDLERLVLLQRWLLAIANNMVSFPDLFAPTRRALFEAGTLILDGRRINLCMKLVDHAAHRKLAESSLMFVAYVDLVRKEGEAEVRGAVAAAVTAGMRGGIAVGKRGVFYDREDREWDAIVTDLIVQPISLVEAIIAPFTRLRDLIVKRVTAMAASEADALEARATEGAEHKSEHGAHGGHEASTQGAGERRSEGGPTLQGMLVSGSVAFAALGSSAAFVVETISAIPPRSALLATAGLVSVMFLIFGLLGWLRLRRRDISALLEACGWALNGRMRLTHKLSLVFTVKPGLPEGAVRKVLVSQGRAVLWVLLFMAMGLAWAVVARPVWFGASDLIPEASTP